MSWFTRQPLHRKLVAIAVAIAAICLSTALGALVLLEYWRIRANAIAETDVLAGIVADNVSGAVSFDEPEAAAELLRSLEVQATIVRACVYLADGAYFAGFSTLDGCPSGSDEMLSTWNRAVAGHPIRAGASSLGTVVLERDLSQTTTMLLGSMGIGLALLTLATLLASALAHRLQRVVSDPIRALADTARRTGGREGYQPIPFGEDRPDEIGDLIRAFNDMVARVSSANDRLVEANAALRAEMKERARAEEERAQLLEREREANRLKDEFLAAVSHELRTPLNAILGWAEVLLASSPQGTERKALTSITRNARTQARLIEDLLDVSRIMSGKLALRMASLDLQTVVAHAVDAVRHVATPKDIVVSTDLADDPCTMEGDAERLHQVVTNLLSNAVKFTPAGGRVDVSLRRAGTRLVLTVTDTGQGLQADFIPKVFEPFRQADGSITREHGGLGLGLAIARELTQMHGGEIEAESPGVGQGATFTVRLPATDNGRVARSSDDRPVVRLDGLRVLAVDDNADALELVTVALRSAGADVLAVESGVEAVTAWRHEPRDVLVSDLAMPQMDGFEVLTRIRAHDAGIGRDTRAIALTAHATSADGDRCRDAGFVTRLAKPCTGTDLVRAVASVTGR